MAKCTFPHCDCRYTTGTCKIDSKSIRPKLAKRIERYENPFIIESATQGVFMGWNFSDPIKPRVRFSVKAKRPEGKRYATAELALQELKVVRQVPRGRRAYVHKLGSRMNVWQPSLEGGNNR